MTKKEKEKIIDDYIKDIKVYLNVGLCEGQANGSFGEDLMRHFDIIAESFKETTLIEHDLGIDFLTLFKALRSGIHIIDDDRPYNDRVDLIYSSGIPCGFKGKVSDHCVFFKDYGKTWTLTKKELK